jgi:drug/metabolite transporter (DMT)-like permease
MKFSSHSIGKNVYVVKEINIGLHTELNNRLETLKLRKRAGQAKFVGTLIGMGGAMLLTFYKGPELKLLRRLPHPKLVHITKAHHTPPPSTGNQILGSFLGITSCFSYATWLVIQVSYLDRTVLLVLQ